MGDFTALPGTALVAGGTGAIGAAIVTMLADRGSRVVFTYRTNASAARTLEREDRVRAVPLDLDDASTVAGTVDREAERAGGLHTVVDAAGPHVPMVHLSHTTPQQLDGQLTADTSAFFALVKASLSHLRDARGSLTAITTAATRRHPVRDGLSSAPKAAVEALVRGLAAEEGRFGVRVNCVGPGMLVDGMATRLVESGELGPHAQEAARSATPMRTFGTANDIAEAACFLASPRARFITGQKLDVDGGYGV